MNGRSWKWLWGVFALLGVLGVSVVLPLPPYGRFRANNIGNIGDAYYEFSKGKVRFVMTDGYGLHADLDVRIMGTYSKLNGNWFMELVDGTSSQLRTTVWNIQMCDSDGTNPVTFRRMISLP